MKIIYIIATLYIGALGVLALFYDYTKMHWYWKLTLGLFALAFIVLSIGYQQMEKKIDEVRRRHSEQTAQDERQDIKRKIDDLREKDRKGMLSHTDYLKYIAYQLEELNLNIIRKDTKHSKDYIINYFSQVDRIPTFFNSDEWKESEKIIYDSSINEINQIFNIRGMFNSSSRIKLIELLSQEREKLLKAKEREFRKNNGTELKEESK